MVFRVQSRPSVHEKTGRYTIFKSSWIDLSTRLGMKLQRNVWLCYFSVLSLDFDFFFSSLLSPYFLLSSLGLTSTMLSTSLNGRNYVIGDLVLRAHLFRIASFCCFAVDRKMPSISASEVFGFDRVAFFKDSLSNLNANLLYCAWKNPGACGVQNKNFWCARCHF